MVAGKAEPAMPGRLYVHPDSPATGSHFSKAQADQQPFGPIRARELPFWKLKPPLRSQKQIYINHEIRLGNSNSKHKWYDPWFSIENLKLAIN